MQRRLLPGAALAAALAGACSSSGGGGPQPVGPYVWSDPASTVSARPAPAAEAAAETAALFEEPELDEPGAEALVADNGDDTGLVILPEKPFSEYAPGELVAGGEPVTSARAEPDPAPPEAGRTTSPQTEAPTPSQGELPTSVGPTPPGEWKIVPPKRSDWGDTYAVQQATEGLRIEDTILQASPRTALILYERRGPYEDIVIKNSILRVEPGTLPLDRSYWGIRGYDVIDMLIEDVEITGFGEITPKHDEGHAIYLNMRGSLTLNGCDIHHNGGQGLQLVNRPAESVFPPGPALGYVSIRNTTFRENGFNPDRGGFQVSIFGTGQDVRIEDVVIAAGFDSTEYPAGQTGGGLLIEAEPYREWRKKPVWWRPEELPEDFEPPFTQGLVELVNVVVNQRDANRPIVQIKGCEELVVRGCTFGPGRIELDAPDKQGRDSGKIVWQQNQGAAIVYVRGERMGLASEDFVIEE